MLIYIVRSTIKKNRHVLSNDFVDADICTKFSQEMYEATETFMDTILSRGVMSIVRYRKVINKHKYISPKDSTVSDIVFDSSASG